jgi:hypothetical protein
LEAGVGKDCYIINVESPCICGGFFVREWEKKATALVRVAASFVMSSVDCKEDCKVGHDYLNKVSHFVIESGRMALYS